MKVNTLSRGTTIDTEQGTKNVGGNRFDLVLVASVRARELSQRHITAEKTTQLNAPVAALIDIQEGRIGKEYLKKVK
jgi:DNA-directed RNA polymerase omega subunit